MITIALLTLWEIALAILPDTQLPGEAIAGLLAICLWMIVGGSLIDVRSGFLGRLAFAFGLAWYISSIGRWAASVDAIYILAGPDVGRVLAVAFLVITPVGMMLVAGLNPLVYVWRRRPWQQG